MSAAPHSSQTSISGQERGRVISDCREFSLRRLRDSLHGMLARIEDDLVARAEAELDRDQRNLYMYTCGKTREKWSGIEQAFLDNITRYFDARVRGEHDPLGQSPGVASLDELCLVDDDALTADLAVNQVSKKLREHCDDSLYGVEQRLGSLLGKQAPTEEDNPISTEAVAAALKAACEQVDASVQMRLVLLQSLEAQISRELGKLYQELNKRLIQFNVLPGLRRGFRRDATVPRTPAAPDESGVAGLTAPAPAPAAHEWGKAAGDSGDGGADVFAMLAQLVQGQLALQGGAPLSQGVAGMEAAPSDAFPSLTGSTVAQNSPFALEALHALQQDLRRRVEGYPLSANLLRDFRASDVGQHLGQFDAITVDIVAMLFDLIFDDEQIADPIKALVGRLQIPLVKVAMMDRGFFSSRAHPARRLLDLISSAMVRWGKDVGHDDPLYRKMYELVDRVLSEFEHDVSLFEELYHDLHAYLQDMEAQEAQRAELGARLVEEREREQQMREEMRRQADHEIDQRLAAPLPHTVQKLLDSVWRPYLYRLGEGGTASDDYQRALATMDELLWSVQPLPEERSVLIAVLPGLLNRINKGFEAVGIDAADKLHLLNGLFELHSGWLKPTSSVVVVPMQDWMPTPAANDASASALQVVKETVQENGFELDSISLNLNAAECTGGDERVAALKRGDWIEFMQADSSWMRYRLNWVSPQRGIYLFTNPGSPRAISVAPDALVLQLQRGEARVIDAEPVFDRAVHRVLASFAQSAQSAA